MYSVLAIEIDREGLTTFCVMIDNTVVYSGTDVNQIRKYYYDEVLVDEPVAPEELAQLLMLNNDLKRNK